MKKYIFPLTIFIIFLNCKNESVSLKNKIFEQTGINVYDSKEINCDNSIAIGDYSISKNIKIDPLNLTKIHKQVAYFYNNRNINNDKWSKIRYGYRLEKLIRNTNEYYQYDFDFINNKIYYLYVEE